MPTAKKRARSLCTVLYGWVQCMDILALNLCSLLVRVLDSRMSGPGTSLGQSWHCIPIPGQDSLLRKVYK